MFENVIAMLSSEPIKTVVLSILTLCVLIVVYLGINSNDAQAGTAHLMDNVILIVLPVVALLCAIILSMDRRFGTYVIAGTGIGIVLFIGMFYFLTTTLSRYIFNKYLFYAMIGSIIMVILTILVTVSARNFRRSYEWSGFLSNLLFYIPCLIRDAIKMGLREYATTTNTVMTLIVLEIILIVIYFYMFFWIDNLAVPENIVVLNEPLMLNNRVTMTHKMKPFVKCPAENDEEIPDFTDKNPGNELVKEREKWIKCLDNKVKTNTFALSFWVYVNPAPETKLAGYEVGKETPILHYGPPTGATDNPYIRLNYSNESDPAKHFKLHVKKNETYENVFLDLKFQRWNNVVFNYITTRVDNSGTPNTKSTLDVFVNGKIAHSFPLATEYNFESKLNEVIIGDGVDNKNLEGLYGAICNIVYYDKHLPKLSIVYKYNRLVLKNPPVNN
jgi:hypothetical protein